MQWLATTNSPEIIPEVIKCFLKKGRIWCGFFDVFAFSNFKFSIGKKDVGKIMIAETLHY